jgi:hypothetical protein
MIAVRCGENFKMLRFPFIALAARFVVRLLFPRPFI